MQFLTLASLFGAALAAPAPRADAKALVSRGSHVSISDIRIWVSAGRFTMAKVTLNWDGVKVDCEHTPERPLRCSNNDYRFHLETPGLIVPDANAVFYVSRKQEIHSFPVHITGCIGDGFSSIKCFPDKSTYSATF